MGCPDWHTAMHCLRLQRLLWIYCPGHAGVRGNERLDRLASTADITSGLQLGRAEMLRGSGNFLNMDRPELHSIDRLKERGVEKGSGRHSTLQGRERSVFNKANIGTVSRATLGRLLRDGAEHVWAFPSATMPSSAETEAETDSFLSQQHADVSIMWEIHSKSTKPLIREVMANRARILLGINKLHTRFVWPQSIHKWFGKSKQKIDLDFSIIY